MSNIRMKELCEEPFVNPQNALQVMFDNRNYAAEAFLSDITERLKTSSSELIQDALKVLSLWDRKEDERFKGLKVANE